MRMSVQSLILVGFCAVLAHMLQADISQNEPTISYSGPLRDRAWTAKESERVLRALFGPGRGWARNAAAALGVTRGAVHQITTGNRPMPHRWRVALRNYAELRPRLLEQELARQQKALAELYQGQLQQVEWARAVLELDRKRAGQSAQRVKR